MAAEGERLHQNVCCGLLEPPAQLFRALPAYRLTFRVEILWRATYPHPHYQLFWQILHSSILVRMIQTSTIILSQPSYGLITSRWGSISQLDIRP